MRRIFAADLEYDKDFHDEFSIVRLLFIINIDSHHLSEASIFASEEGRPYLYNRRCAKCAWIFSFLFNSPVVGRAE